MKERLMPQERHWILYDVGNSAFVLLSTTILPIYFHALASGGGLSETAYLAYWGYAASIGTLLTAFSGPILGAVSDAGGRKKPLFLLSVVLGSVICFAIGLAQQWLLFLFLFVLARVCYSVSLIFYDSMLPDITSPDRVDRLSAQGFAWGYIGSCIPFVLCLGLVLGADSLGLSLPVAMMLSFWIVALWWLGCTLPLLRSYRQRYFVHVPAESASGSLARLGHTLLEIARNRRVLLFLLAFFFYIDGVYTIIEMATAYGTALGLDSTGLLLALLVTQFVAFPCSLLIGRLAARYGPERLLPLCILAYFGIAVYAVFLRNQPQFWGMAVAVGMFQGGIQALSRSYFAKIIPPEKSGEYFGLMDICGKGASILGTSVVSLISQLTGSVQLGVGTMALFFLLGLAFFLRAVRCPNPAPATPS